MISEVRLMLVMLVANAEEQDITIGCGLSKEKGYVLSMLIVVGKL